MKKYYFRLTGGGHGEGSTRLERSTEATTYFKRNIGEEGYFLASDVETLLMSCNAEQLLNGISEDEH